MTTMRLYLALLCAWASDRITDLGEWVLPVDIPPPDPDVQITVHYPSHEEGPGPQRWGP